MPVEEPTSAFSGQGRALRILRNSKLVVYDEYKKMIRDIQRYKDGEKRELSNGIRKRENDMRPYLYDTGDSYEKPFFSVLTKMLLEITSIKNSQRQTEDLQRVYQWYVTNKRQLCRTDKHFSPSQDSSKTLKYRPSSSIDPGVKHGILRHEKVGRNSYRHQRPQTSFSHLDSRDMSSLKESNTMDTVFTVNGFEGIHAPEIPKDLRDYKPDSTQVLKSTIKRPETAPAHIMLDHTPVSKGRYFSTKADYQLDPSEDMQLPVSKVSIHYTAPGENSENVQVNQIERFNQNSSPLSHSSNKIQRSKSADYLQKGVYIQEDLPGSDLQSEIDEDRVSIDADQIVKNAQMSDDQQSEEKSSEEFSIETQADASASQSTAIEQSKSLNTGEVIMEKGVSVKEQHAVLGERSNSSIQQEKQKFEYIPSYSKFQQLKERKHMNYKDELNCKESSNTQAVSQSPRSLHHSIAKKQVDPHSGLNKNGLTTSSILQLVTPVGQQMLEQKPPIQINHQEFRKDVRQSPSNSPHSSPRDRLSPRLYLRPTAALKGDSANQALRKAEIMFPEESPRQYKVHFPQDRNAKTEKHYKISGPVEPDSLRYRYTHDGFGSRTYVKKLTKPQMQNRTGKVTAKQCESPQSVFKNSSRIPNSKTLASSMIIKHLGGCDRRSSDRMSGQSTAVPMWIASQDSENQKPDDTQFVKLTKPYDKDSSFSSELSENKRPKYHVKQIDVDVLNSFQPLYLIGDDRGEKAQWETGRFTETLSTQRGSPNTPDVGSREMNKLDWLNQYNGGYFPLKAEGHAVQVGEKSQSVSGKSPSQSLPQTQKISRPGSQYKERSNSPSLNKSRPLSACSKASNRLGSARSSRHGSAQSTRRPHSHAKSTTEEQVDQVFSVNKFSHYCFDDNPALEDDYQRQRKTNAAVDIQRIFRGYIARKYARELKHAEKDRQKRAAIKIQSAMRGYLTRKRMIEYKVSQRPPQVDIVEWEKTYKEHLKKKDNERMVKAQTRNKKLIKLQVKQDDKMRKVSASKAIHEIFHDKSPTKAQMKAAAITIQRFVRGWLVRKFYQNAKSKAMKRTLDFKGFLNTYRDHLQRIMERHGEKDSKAIIAFDELLEYIEKRNKYEIEYDRIAKGKKQESVGIFTYEDIKKFFEACGKHPSRKEVEDAIDVCLSDIVELKEHAYTKAQIVEIAFQIYVPKGTKLVDTRKSTWLNPLVGGDEAARIKLSKKVNEATSLGKVFEFVSQTKRGQVEMEQRAITPDLLPLDAKLNGFEKLNEKPVSKPNQSKKKK